MGFLNGQKAVQCYDLFKRTMRISWNVAFSEKDEPNEVEFPPTTPSLQLEGAQQNVDSNP